MHLPAEDVDAEAEETVDTPDPDKSFEEALVDFANNLDRHIAEGLAAQEKQRLAKQAARVAADAAADAATAADTGQRNEQQQDEEGNRLDYKKCLDKLAAFFEQRVNEKRWTLYQRMPRKGRDLDFDSLLEALLLSANRPYASRKWKEFKDSKGIYPPPTFETDPDTLVACYRTRVATRGTRSA